MLQDPSPQQPTSATNDPRTETKVAVAADDCNPSLTPAWTWVLVEEVALVAEVAKDKQRDHSTSHSCQERGEIDEHTTNQCFWVEFFFLSLLKGNLFH